MKSLEIYTALEHIRKELNKRPDKAALAKKLENPKLSEKGKQAIQQQLDKSDENIKKIIKTGTDSLEKLKFNLSLDDSMRGITGTLFNLMVNPAVGEQTVKPDEQIKAHLPNVTLPYNPNVYNTMLGYAKLMFTAEKNGIAEEHAYKLATIFDRADAALKYLEAYRKSNPKEEQLMHNACNFALPQGKLDWGVWRVVAARNLEDATFRNRILPQACEIEETIKASLKKPTKEEVKVKVDEISTLNSRWKKLNAKHSKLTEKKIEEFDALTRMIASKNVELAELGIPFDKQLSLVALKAYRDKAQQESSEAYKTFLEHGLSKNDVTAHPPH